MMYTWIFTFTSYAILKLMKVSMYLCIKNDGTQKGVDAISSFHIDFTFYFKFYKTI